MLIDKKLSPSPLQAMQSVDALKDFHRDRYVQLSHEMPEETAEASARTLIRTVPLIYGLLLGAVLDNILIGLPMGLALSVALDMRMGKQSFFLPWFGPVLAPFCPLINAGAHGLAGLIRAIGLPAPAFLAEMQCRLPKR